jgi:hypothetical protein
MIDFKSRFEANGWRKGEKIDVYYHSTIAGFRGYPDVYDVLSIRYWEDEVCWLRYSFSTTTARTRWVIRRKEGDQMTKIVNLEDAPIKLFMIGLQMQAELDKLLNVEC